MGPIEDDLTDGHEVEGFWWRRRTSWWRHHHPIGYAGPPDPRAQLDMLAVSPVAESSGNHWGGVSFKP